MKVLFSIMLSLSVSFLLPSKAFAQSNVSVQISVEDAWSRATAPGMPMAAVYGKLINTGDEDLSLVSIATSVARLAEVHESVEINGMMRMREITPFVVPGGGVVSLQPGGKHFMLMGVKQALQEGEYVDLEMTFSDGSELIVQAIIGGFGQMEMPEVN